MVLGALASIGIGAYFTNAIIGFLLIAAIFTLLYVLKVGPASWNMPSQRALNRQRLREIKDAERARAIERRAQRLELQHEFKSKAYSLACGAMRRR
ncbi:hypothetical protein [Corynebacterium mastitidis]